MRRTLLILLALSGLAAPLSAKESLGIFGDWGAFRDSSIPRCYAIAQPFESAERSDHLDHEDHDRG